MHQRWETPGEVVSAFGLMQGQELTVFSSIALRAPGGVAAVQDALVRGGIVRGYPMRGTVFAVAAEDLRWMTELLAKPGPERARARCAEAGVDAEAIERVRRRVLAEGPLTNAQFRAILFDEAPQAHTGAAYRVRYLLLIDGTCAYIGTDQLLGPAPVGPSLEQRFNGDTQAAADEVVRRYVSTHGPVTAQDVAWWSKLPVRQVRTALAHLGFEEIAGEHFRASLLDELSHIPRSTLKKPLLLPAFDEYILGYKDRTFAMTDLMHAHLAPSNMGVFRKAVVVDGTVRGTWKAAGGVLVVEDVAGVPKYAEAGIRKKFRSFPFYPPRAR